MEDKVLVPYAVESVCCRQSFTLLIDLADLHDWKHGKKYIQNTFPYLTEDQRELLLTGTCGPCFDEIFPDDDDFVWDETIADDDEDEEWL